jgi:hypothetical protein
MTTCFKCGGTEIVVGQIKTSRDSSWLRDTYFLPADLRLMTAIFGKGVRLCRDSYACVGCGTVWSETETGELREFIREHSKA